MDVSNYIRGKLIIPMRAVSMYLEVMALETQMDGKHICLAVWMQTHVRKMKLEMTTRIIYAKKTSAKSLPCVMKLC